MRTLDLLLSRYPGADRSVKRAILARLGHLPLDLESDILVGFLLQEVDSDQHLATEARRALFRQRPRHWERLELRLSYSLGRDGSSWTRYIFHGGSAGDAPSASGPDAPDARLCLAAAFDLLSRSIDPLALVARDGPVRARRAAIDALGSFPCDDVVQRLVALLGDRAVSGAVALALERIDLPAATVALVEALDRFSGKPEEADLVLALAGRGEAVADRLCEVMGRNPPVEVRFALARALAELPGDGAPDRLLRLADDQDRTVRIVSLDALGGREGRAAFEVASRAFESADDPAVQAAAVGAAGRAGQEASSSVLGTALRHPSPDVRVSAVEAAMSAGLNDQVLCHLLTPAIDDSNPRVAAAAAVALGPIVRSRTLDWISRSTSAANPLQRAAGAWALGYVRGDRATRFLGELLTTESEPFVLTQLARSLAKHAGAQGTQVLARSIGHPCPEVRRVAARAALRPELIGSEPVVGALMSAWRTETDPDAARRQATALARLSVDDVSELVENRVAASSSEDLPWLLEALGLVPHLAGSTTARKALTCGDPASAAAAARLLWRLGEVDPVLALAAELGAGDEGRALACARVFEEVGQTVPVLARCGQRMKLQRRLRSHAKTADAGLIDRWPAPEEPGRSAASRNDQEGYRETSPTEQEQDRTFGADGQRAPQPVPAADVRTSPTDASISGIWRAPMTIAPPEAPPPEPPRSGPGPSLEARLELLALVRRLSGTGVDAARVELDRILGRCRWPAALALAETLEKPAGPARLETRLRTLGTYLETLSQRLSIARARLSRGEVDRAQTLLSELEADLPRVEWAALRVGRALYAAEDWLASVEQLEVALVHAPAEPRIALLLASAAHSAGLVDYARALVEPLLTLPDLDERLRIQARQLMRAPGGGRP